MTESSTFSASHQLMMLRSTQIHWTNYKTQSRFTYKTKK